MSDKSKNTIQFGTSAVTEYGLEDARLAELRTSTNPEDRVTAILMDVEVGSCSFWEQYARQKAKAVLEVLGVGNTSSESKV